jgi:hypothetical protein
MTNEQKLRDALAQAERMRAALEAIIRRVALVSPYYEMAREALTPEAPPQDGCAIPEPLATYCPWCHHKAHRLTCGHVIVAGSIHQQREVCVCIYAQEVASTGEPITKNSVTAMSQRVWDLLRYQRMELHNANLITNEEYAALAFDHPAVARLETYDELRAELARLTAQEPKE